MVPGATEQNGRRIVSVDVLLLEITQPLVAQRTWPTASREIKISMISITSNVPKSKP